MDFDQYVGLDVNKASNVSCVVNGVGQRIFESLVPTKLEAVQDLLGGIGRRVASCTTHAAWLYEVVTPLVAEVVVCRSSLGAIAGRSLGWCLSGQLRECR